MGKKAEFARSRFKEVRQKREERMQRSRTERDRRHGIDKLERKIGKVVVQRPLPNEAQQALLLAQFAQACRLVAPSTDMCILMRHYAKVAEAAEQKSKSTTMVTTSAPSAKSTTRKRKRDEAEEEEEEAPAAGATFLDTVADALLQTQNAPAVIEEAAASAKDGENALDDDDDDDDTVTVLQDILQDDNGRRVVATLLASLNAVHSSKCEAVAKAVLEQFEENEHLPQHHVACRVMSALAQFGSDPTRQGVLNLLRQRSTTIEGVERLLSDRHTAGTIEQLLKSYSRETAAWLCEALSLSTPVTSPSAAEAGGKKKKAAKQRDAAAEETASGERITTEKLMELVNGPVSGQVLLQLLHTDARRELLKRLPIVELLRSKRGTTFLTQLLMSTASVASSKGDEGREAEAVALFSDVLERLGNDLGEMAIDKRANFVVQALIQLLPAMGPQSAKQLERLERGLGGAAGISALVAHGNGVHVVLSLIDAALTLSSESAVEGLAEQLVTRQNVTDLLYHKHGSLVVRRLMPLISRKASKVGRLLQGMVEQDFSNLVYTEAGNLVVTAYLTALGKSGASLLAQKLAGGEELLSMCRSPYASHVVFTLFELVDPITHTLLCNALKAHVLPLSIHVNGRFIVEKMIAASRDVRESVSRQFLSLAQERGTQHVLCALLARMDARGKQACVEKTIMPNLTALATHQCGSIVLQKLMQAEPTVLSAVRQRLSANSLVRSDLAQNFFGKFVVQIAQQPEQEQPQ
ncbi:putative pumillio protein 10 [Leishmania major strain Friedlin]|uniref:Putative pumillio protein 10 n=1 Tax=Leishmania major TaxID=5664 RepID=Q4QH33_LEIMA|nr:putative pumillio protein 10 [Leishmania major strain Friedlin]CAG9570169.1 pumillio_protein_10_-_putative [Leishmania major strain Friedlin]CAJ02575.1 putative pumillio protein 10 [Leishmania major strain Friedlin]|eukprot:XP_001681515.1 putative pumillio protein 10 [Leishmania major strain Friedlin]